MNPLGQYLWAQKVAAAMEPRKTSEVLTREEPPVLTSLLLLPSFFWYSGLRRFLRPVLEG